MLLTLHLVVHMCNKTQLAIVNARTHCAAEQKVLIIMSEKKNREKQRIFAGIRKKIFDFEFSMACVRVFWAAAVFKLIDLNI